MKIPPIDKIPWDKLIQYGPAALETAKGMWDQLNRQRPPKAEQGEVQAEAESAISTFLFRIEKLEEAASRDSLLLSELKAQVSDLLIRINLLNQKLYLFFGISILSLVIGVTGTVLALALR